jgi:transposase, IS30 family
MPVSEMLRREVAKRSREGQSIRSIAQELDCPVDRVKLVVGDVGGSVRACHRDEVMRGSLGWEQRVMIFDGLCAGMSYRVLGVQIGCSAATICREVVRGGGRHDYKASVAHRLARRPIVRSHPRKLDNPLLVERVSSDLRKLFSPEQIAGRLREEFGPGSPGQDASMTISHETIYKSLYVQGKGQLRRELAACLRTGRAARKQRGERSQRGQISGKIMITERPAEAHDRAVPGHWEGDLIIGAFSRSAIGTLVERTTRLVILLHLPDNHTAEAVRDAMVREISRLPQHLTRSITWDQGKEMSEHARFTAETGISVYFCDPHSPWQRGTNENTNGLLRQYFPKGTDLSVHTAEDLANVAASLNERPRKTLGYRTPAEQMALLLQ